VASEQQAGSPKEMELLRASAVPESAVLVVRGGKYVGLRIELAADEDHLYVSFRAPTNVIEGSAVVLRLKVFLSMDLLAQAVAVGCSNQSGCVCLWCDEGPKDFKKTTQSPDSVLTLRTCASQAKNLAVYEAQTGKKKSGMRSNSRFSISCIAVQSIYSPGTSLESWCRECVIGVRDE